MADALRQFSGFSYQLDKLFNSLDANGDGFVSADELSHYIDVSVLASEKMPLESLANAKLTREMFRVAMDSVVAKMALLGEPTQEDMARYRLVFDSLDKDKSNSISLKELLDDMGATDTDADSIKQMFTTADTNANTQLSFEEFVVLMRKAEQKQSKSMAQLLRQAHESFRVVLLEGGENLSKEETMDKLKQMTALVDLQRAEMNKLMKQIVSSQQNVNAETLLASQDELVTVKMELTDFQAQADDVSNLKAEVLAVQQSQQIWKEKAVNALKARDEVAEKNRLLMREIRQGKSQIKVKESEISILEEKLRMTEDVILKSRNRRLDDIDQRMKQEQESIDNRDSNLSQLNESLASLHEQVQRLTEELTTRKDLYDQLQQQNFGLVGEIKKFDSVLGITESRELNLTLADVAATLEKGTKFDQET
eukprot:c10081_g1_i2.p1 GENE.c10081_g1_i2~~c10081_g1_i2.p1  ORF type:complete len:441 (-),score=130.46 c10081_g1_i2:191-1462(-)